MGATIKERHSHRWAMPALDSERLKTLIAKDEERKAGLVKQNREKSADLRALQFNEEGRQNDERLAVDRVQGRIEALDQLVKDGCLSQQEADEEKRPLVAEKTRIQAEHKLKKKEFEVVAEPLAEDINRIRADIRNVDGRLEQWRDMLGVMEPDAPEAQAEAQAPSAA